MFQFTPLASHPMDSGGDDSLMAAGFPHSGIAGSKDACSSPTLFAAYRALPRLSVPRHPPCALIRLTGLCFDAPRLSAWVPHFLTEPLSLQVLAYTLSPDPSCQ